MFQWDKSISRLDLPASAILQLFRSVRDVQLALPGLPSQAATAYLCQYRQGGGVVTVAAFHLLKSGQLACYLETPGEAGPDQADAMLDQAMVFIESMGFLMTDLDIRQLGEEDRAMLWASLPLLAGSSVETVAGPARPETGKGGERRSLGRADSLDGEPLQPPAEAAAVAPLPTPLTVPPLATASLQPPQFTADTNSDELPATAASLHSSRPETRGRKKPSGPDELNRRREELRKHLGRILASL